VIDSGTDVDIFAGLISLRARRRDSYKEQSDDD